MKKTLITAAMAVLSTASMAQHRHHDHRHSDVITPMIIGGMIAYGISQANRRDERRDDPPVVVYQQVPQVIYQSAPRVYPLNRAPEPVYERRTQYEPSCSCHIDILVQIGWK